MIICVDLGNTSISIAFFENNNIVYQTMFLTDIKKSATEYEIMLSNYIKSNNIDVEKCDGGIVSSVVPSLTNIIKRVVEKICHCFLMNLNKGLKTGLAIRIDHPNELGADLVADAVSAINGYDSPIVVIDFGTATKLIIVDNNKALIGCIFLPGLEVSYRALIDKGAQLLDIDFTKPAKVIGKNTISSLNSGAIYGNVEAVMGLIRRIEHETNSETKKVITGGYAHYFVDEFPSDYVFDEDLLMKGLHLIYLKNVNNNEKYSH